MQHEIKIKFDASPTVAGALGNALVAVAEAMTGGKLDVVVETQRMRNQMVRQRREANAVWNSTPWGPE